MSEASRPLSKSGVFWATLRAILVAAVILIGGYVYIDLHSDDSAAAVDQEEPEEEQPPGRNTAVDMIDGYKSVKLGTPREQLADRLEQEFPDIDKNPNDAMYVVTKLLPGEDDWAGIGIAGVRVQVRHGMVTTVLVEINKGDDLLTLREAFTKKYGDPTDRDDWRWQGNNTNVWFVGRTVSGGWVSIERKTTTEGADTLDKQEQDRIRNKQEQRAKEVSDKL